MFWWWWGGKKVHSLFLAQEPDHGCNVGLLQTYPPAFLPIPPYGLSDTKLWDISVYYKGTHQSFENYKLSAFVN